jgi:hypothetical protein
MAAVVPIPWGGEGGAFSAGLVATAIHEGTLKQAVNRLLRLTGSESQPDAWQTHP